MRAPKILSLLAFTLVLAACGQPASEATATLPAPVVEAATATPTREPGLLILLAPEGADTELAAQSAAIMQSYAAERGLLFEQRGSLDASTLPANLVALAALSPTSNLGDLAAAAPQASFVAVGYEPAAQMDNLYSLTLSATGSEAAAFLAGYVAAMSTDDWRVGVLYAPGENLLANGFLAGAEYFCGSCAPLAPPYEEYPLSAEANQANWQGAPDSLLSQGVSTIYLTPSLEIVEVVQYLAARNVLVIGQGAPPSGLEAAWLASVGSGQPAELAAALPAALDGQPLESGAFGLTYANGSYLSAARLAFIQDLITDLESGYIRLPSEP